MAISIANASIPKNRRWVFVTKGNDHRLIVAVACKVALAYSDLLMMLPVQWTQSPLLRDVVQPIEIGELLPAPPICLVRRAGLPLTPAAEYFCDMMRRAVLHRDSLGA